MEGRPRPLEGVPYGLKDIFIETAGIRTTGGSRMYADHAPGKDAAVAARLADAGGVLLAKLGRFEFAAGANAVTSNPWDLARTAARSSSGSGAAVAARELPLSIGTDTGGSVAIPASFVGIAGLKATFGRVPVQRRLPALVDARPRRTDGPLGRGHRPRPRRHRRPRRRRPDVGHRRGPRLRGRVASATCRRCASASRPTGSSTSSIPTSSPRRGRRSRRWRRRAPRSSSFPYRRRRCSTCTRWS